MLSHDRIWAAIDRLAEQHRLSVSALARRAGLDPTTFNRSKRKAGDGRPRWPSTESIAKILEATGTRMSVFIDLVEETHERKLMPFRHVPLLGLAQAGAGGFFEDGGFPAGHGLDQVPFPATPSENVFALEVSGDSMLPLYRRGDTLIVVRDATIRRGDRVVVKTSEGEVMAKILERQTPTAIELASLNPDHPTRTFAPSDIEWMARIIWASQ